MRLTIVSPTDRMHTDSCILGSLYIRLERSRSKSPGKPPAVPIAIVMCHIFDAMFDLGVFF